MSATWDNENILAWKIFNNEFFQATVVTEKALIYLYQSLYLSRHS